MSTTERVFDPNAFKETTRQQWNDAAEAWNRWSPLLSRWLGPATERMLDMTNVEAGSRVLDVAAGAGEQTAEGGRLDANVGEALARAAPSSNDAQYDAFRAGQVPRPRSHVYDARCLLTRRRAGWAGARRWAQARSRGRPRRAGRPGALLRSGRRSARGSCSRRGRRPWPARRRSGRGRAGRGRRRRRSWRARGWRRRTRASARRGRAGCGSWCGRRRRPWPAGRRGGRSRRRSRPCDAAAGRGSVRSACLARILVRAFRTRPGPRCSWPPLLRTPR